MTSPLTLVVVLLMTVVAVGCGGGSTTEADAGADGRVDATPVGAEDAAQDEPPADGNDGGVTAYGDIADSTRWSSFDTASVDTESFDFAGATFDGRYLYFAPNAGDGVARYDTQASFASPTSWSTFHTANVDSKAYGFAGAAFDGRYVYFVPQTHGVVVRYDTQASFTTSAAWSTFDTQAALGAFVYAGATFDGRYLYFVPYFVKLVARYDTQASFTAASSWQAFDVSKTNTGAQDFYGAVFDGRFVYLVPNFNTTYDGIVARYDTQAPFTATASWLTFDVASVNAQAKGFLGGAFDGRYVYFVPNYNGAYDGVAARYDTQAGFTAPSSWSTVDTTAVAPTLAGFQGAAFDGRFIYLAPAHAGVAARYDTHASSFGASAWSSFDTSGLHAGQQGCRGAVFDGRFVYFVPAATGIVLRFDARSPASMPNLPAWTGSFF